MPRGVGVRAAAVAGGEAPVAQARDAATVVLLRDTPAGVEALLLCRARQMDFAPGAYVFPGGSVDPADGAGLDWAGPSPAELSAVLGVPADRCRAAVCAAVRETFEECGVLLAGDQPLPGDGPLTQDREALLAGTASLGEVLRRRGLVLPADVLIPWGRWITPEAAERRYDTWFFAAAMPAGQVPDASAESDSAVWLTPAGALAAARAGEIVLLPPTAVTLAELAGHDTVAGALAAPRTITPRMPTVLVEDGTTWLEMPDGVEYPL